MLKTLKDMDDMDADLFGPKTKPGSAPVQAKRFSTLGSTQDPSGVGRAEATTVETKKPSYAPSASTAHGYRKFDFSDLDDPLADLLDELDLEETKSEAKKFPAKKVELSPTGSPALRTKEPVKTTRKREELTFDDDEGDLLDHLNLGLDDDKAMPKKKEPQKTSSDAPQTTRTRLDEILGRGTPPRLLERPPTGEQKDQAVPINRQDWDKPASAKEALLEDDLGLGSAYQPTLGSAPEGRQSRRQLVRFSMEDISSSTLERKPKVSSTASSTASKPAPNTTNHALGMSRVRSSADWLGLKPSDELTFLDDHDHVVAKLNKDTPSTSPATQRRSSLSGDLISTNEKAGAVNTRDPAPSPIPSPSKAPKSEAGRSQKVTVAAEEEEEEDWLQGALSRRKGLAASQPERRRSRQEESPGLGGGGGEEDMGSTVSQQAPSPSPSPVTRRRERDENSLSLRAGQITSAGVHSTPVNHDKKTPATQPTPSQMTAPAVQQQVTLSSESLQQLLQQQLMQSQFLGVGGALDLGSLQSQQERKEHLLADCQALQARIVHLEGQVRSLKLDRDQNQMLLDNVQQRHKQDMELVENAHKARVRLLEESWSQREARAQRENEELAERLADAAQQAERDRAELQAQHQRRLAQAQLERDQEVQRLRDLQRQSVLEVKKDHEEQIQRLKRLKDEEINAVTSATSQTRSLTGVMEQMEGFSNRLGELSCRVESTHEHTTQGLEQGARQREEQLRVMQERLQQQQSATTEERSRLKEVITRMEVQLAEQQRQLEKERWRVAAEQAKAESAQRGVEEERRSLQQHASMEREELERAKSALLDEQQAVMHRCGEERRKMAGEWAELHAAEKQRQEQADRQASRHLERDAHTHASIISMAQEQADLKLRAGELQQREEALTREREALEAQRMEAQREQEKLRSTALRLQSRAQEVEAFSKLATDRFEEGERALLKARGVESEHQARLRSIHTQMEQLRLQEQGLLQERARMSGMRGAERFRPGLGPLSQPTTPHLTHTDFSLMLPKPELLVASVTSDPGTADLQARLALLRHTAEKDRDFLQDEQFFLETLKKNTLQSAFHTQ